MTPSPSAARRSAARACAQTARRSGRRLQEIRARLAAPARGTPVAAGRADALLAAYDLYARMLSDALLDVATLLRRDGTAGGPVPPPPAGDVARADVAGPVRALRDDLERLRLVLVPFHRAGPSAVLDPATEWALAVDGLLGAAGVVAALDSLVSADGPQRTDGDGGTAGDPGRAAPAGGSVVLTSAVGIGRW